jgi:hypothetical protein
MLLCHFIFDSEIIGRPNLHTTFCIAEVGYLMLALPGAHAKLKNKRANNNKCQIEKLLPEQVIGSELLFIISGSSPNFDNAMLCAGHRVIKLFQNRSIDL